MSAGWPSSSARKQTPRIRSIALRRRLKSDPIKGNLAEAGRVIVDFGNVTPLTGLQDGFAFGLRPVRPGDLRMTVEREEPRFGLSLAAFAGRDRAFQGLKLTDETERDHGRIGTWERAGQTLRTPEFTIGNGHLWYRARGAGRAYAAVNSHVLVAGPLHAKVMTEWTDGEKGWRWVRHDLSGYEGHRAHIEFSPVARGDLELAAIVETDQATEPEAALSPSNARFCVDGCGSPEEQARALQTLLAETVRRMEADAIDGGSDATAVATMAAWLVRDPELFSQGSGRAVIELLREEARRLRDAEALIARELATASPTAPAMVDGTGVNEHLLIRGSSRTPGPEVPRRFLEAIAGEAPLENNGGGSGRLALAQQLVSRSNPLVARVIVNRVWHHLFGRGIVASVDNFGVLGEPPSHRELLDHLADRLVSEGWSLKRLIRAIVLTRAYGMSSRGEPGGDTADPDNRLLHRMPIRRLEAEAIRDAILAVSGRADNRMAGPSVPVYLTSFMTGRGRPSTSGPLDGDGRRSLYLSIRRNFLNPMMLAFDAPIPFTANGRRNVSNVPAQALILMNDPFVVEQSRRWADRVLAGQERGTEARIAGMYRAAFARAPEPRELAEAVAFLEEQGRALALPAAGRQEDRRVWADLAHVLFNAKEFIFID